MQNIKRNLGNLLISFKLIGMWGAYIHTYIHPVAKSRNTGGFAPFWSANQNGLVQVVLFSYPYFATYE